MNRIQIKLYSANGQLYNWNESYEIHVHTKNYKLQKTLQYKLKISNIATFWHSIKEALLHFFFKWIQC